MRWLPSFRNDSSGFRNDTSGAAAVEMALMLPMLVVLIFTTFEGGNYMWNEHKVVKGVRDGARYAARTSFSNFNCGAGTVNSAVVTSIQELTRTGKLTGGTAKVSGWTNSNVAVTLACVSGAGGLYGTNSNNAPVVTVTANVLYPSLFRTLGFNTSGVRLYSKASSAVMGL